MLFIKKEKSGLIDIYMAKYLYRISLWDWYGKISERNGYSNNSLLSFMNAHKIFKFLISCLHTLRMNRIY